MTTDSGIEWTDDTRNFWWGCFKVSPGCKNCYAEGFAKRVGRDIWGPASTTARWRTKGVWADIVKADKKYAAEGVRKKAFVQSMSDTFEEHPQLDEWREEMFAILESLVATDVQLLTKRPENVARMVPAHWMTSWPKHIWMGTSVENQAAADERIPHLLKIPAAVRFLSVEPLLGPVLLDNGESSWLTCTSHLTGEEDDATLMDNPCCESFWAHGHHYHGIDWVIVGGESGGGARPFDLDWAESLRRQCQDAGVAFFMKQIGDNAYWNGARFHAGRKGHDMDKWPSWLRVREFPVTEYA